MHRRLSSLRSCYKHSNTISVLVTFSSSWPTFRKKYRVDGGERDITTAHSDSINEGLQSSRHKSANEKSKHILWSIHIAQLIWRPVIHRERYKSDLMVKWERGTLYNRCDESGCYSCEEGHGWIVVFAGKIIKILSLRQRLLFSAHLATCWIVCWQTDYDRWSNSPHTFVFSILGGDEKIYVSKVRCVRIEQGGGSDITLGTSSSFGVTIDLILPTRTKGVRALWSW